MTLRSSGRVHARFGLRSPFVRRAGYLAPQTSSSRDPRRYLEIHRPADSPRRIELKHWRYLWARRSMTDPHPGCGCCVAWRRFLSGQPLAPI
jgi:hypothetical protein